MDKSALFSIGYVAKLFHLSVGTLRHYEKLGILIPEYTDPNTSYRYYCARQFEILNTVCYLRTLDMPLLQIADFLQNRDIEVIKNKLLQQKEIVVQKKKELEKIEKKIDNRLRQIGDAQASEFDTVKITVFPDCRIIKIRDSLNLNNPSNLEPTLRRLGADEEEPMIFLGKVGVGIMRERLEALQFDSYDYAFIILDDEDSYGGETETLCETKCVSIRFHGTHPDAPQVYQRLLSYIKENGLSISGFSREITMIDYGLTNDTEKFVTEINIPVF